MRTTLLVASIIGSACAAVNIGHPILQRDLNALIPRDTQSAGAIPTQCESAVSEILKSVPTPPAKLASAEQDADKTNTDPCSYHPASSVEKEYSSYTSEVLSWYSKHSKEVESAFTACPEIQSLASGVIKLCPTDSNVPSALRAAATATASDDSTKSGDKSETKTSDSAKSGSTSASGSTSTSKGAAPRETGMAFAAIAVGLAAAAL